MLAKHIAHLFIRDPISLFAEKLVQDVENDTDHFEVLILTHNMMHIVVSLVSHGITCNVYRISVVSFYVCFLQNIQSTNWQSMRFKLPPPHSTIGYRVEFRPLEVHVYARVHLHIHVHTLYIYMYV